MNEYTGEERRKHCQMDEEISGLVRELYQRQKEVVIPKLDKIDELCKVVQDHTLKIDELWRSRNSIMNIVFSVIIVALIALVIKK